MRWFKKNKEPEEKCEYVRVHKLVKTWSDDKAALHYVLYQGDEIRTSDGKTHMDTSMYQGSRPWHDDQGWRVVASGDTEWANRIANHYGIEITEDVQHA